MTLNRLRKLWVTCLVVAALELWPVGLRAQFTDVPQFSLNVEVDVARAADLVRAESYLKDGQWVEAVDTIQRVMETEGEQLIVSSDVQRGAKDEYVSYITLREKCHRLLAAAHRSAPEALAEYRRRVDPLARRWFVDARESRDARLLQRIVDQFFTSSFGDDALYRLAEISLEQGEYATARKFLERISPLIRVPRNSDFSSRDASELPWWHVLRDTDIEEHWPVLEPLLTEARNSNGWLAYPDTDLKIADIRARLVLVSILEGSPERARSELALLERLHPNAEGRMAGRSGKCVERLGALLSASQAWMHENGHQDWPTFAGSPSRSAQAEHAVDVRLQPIWSIALPRESAEGEMVGFGRQRVAESAEGLLSYHPVIATTPDGDKMVFWSDWNLLRSARLDSNRADLTDESAPDQTSYKTETLFELFKSGDDRSRLNPNARPHVGVPRYTVTVHGEKVFARMGSPLTGERDEDLRTTKSRIVGFELRYNKVLPGFPIFPEKGSRWQFEGTPVSDGARLFVAMRNSGPRSSRAELHVACYDLPTVPLDDLSPTWRVKICDAETITAGDWDELTHTLLSLHEGTVYCNSNLGVVAAIRAEDGQVQWLTQYPRAPFRSGDPDRSDLHYFRDLNPCVCHKGMVIAAPRDCDRIFALDMMTGQLLWECPIVDAVHLLGVGNDRLIASGVSLHWIDVYSGEIVGQFPRPGVMFANGLARSEPVGYGRGVLAGDYVLWPTREQIFVFEQRTRREEVDEGPATWKPVMARQPIRLAPAGMSGGNLVVSDGVLLIATPDKLIALEGYPLEK